MVTFGLLLLVLIVLITGNLSGYLAGYRAGTLDEIQRHVKHNRKV